MAWRWAFDLVTTVSSLRGRERGEREGEAEDALDAGAGHDRDVGRDLDRQAAMRAPADAGILALGILAHDHPVELRAAHLAQRAYVIPGSTRAGRTLAYWSNGWQIASRRPQRLMWSGTSGEPTAPK